MINIFAKAVRPFRGKSAQNSLWILVERIVSIGITTIITVLSARYLGTENFGILNYGLTLTSLFAGIMKLGLDSIMVNELINNKNQQGALLGTSIALRLASSILSILSIGVLLLILNRSQPLVILVSLIQSIILIFQAAHIFDFWFQSNLASKYVSIAKIVATTITSSYSAYLLFTGKSLVWFAVSTVLTGLIVAAVLLFYYKKQGGQSLVFSKKTAKYLLSKSHHFIIANIISLVYVQIDKLMIGNMIGKHELGLYSAALMLCTAWAFLPDSIITSLRPSIMHAKNNSNEQLYLKRLKQLYFIIFWLSTGVAMLITLAAPIIIPILFGDDFKNAVQVTQIAVWYAPLSTLGTARSVWTVSEKKYKYPKYYLFHGLVLNISLNLILIPQWGIIGAAISTVLTELLTCFISPLFYRETRIHPRIVLSALIHK